MLKGRNHLVAYTERVDDMVENAFHCNIRDSMNKLCRAITEDSKMSHRPLFEVVIVLRQSSPKSLPKVQQTHINVYVNRYLL